MSRGSSNIEHLTNKTIYMKKYFKLVLLVAFLIGGNVYSWAQAPSTEGQDFWVTFLRAADDDPTELKLTISAREACDVVIENTNTSFRQTRHVGDNSSTELVIAKANCYSSTAGTATYTALHVTATKDISLFAGNYRDKSFDATNVLPTAALLDDYLIQTYPPSDHEDNPQGSHFAIIAVEDNTVVDYNLTATSTKEAIGAHSVTLQKGQVWYVWTGLNKDDAADLSGTTVKAREGKKIAVFQGCPHTNIPNHVRDRDHIVSQAMPNAYWGSEFGITASRKHRRDIVAIMAINDGTEVYINSPDGEPVRVHTFDFSVDKKHYWTFEIGESLAYCADNEGQSPSHGQLPPPLVVDSSCYITTSCPAGVHLFMVSNRYDNITEKVKSDTLVSDPAMLWISPIEQVIKEINFATYKTTQAKFHFMNIVTTTSNVSKMVWTDENKVEHNIAPYFHMIRGNEDYSFARIEIQHGAHNLKGDAGFLAHVYGYGERESYAYSCGSSTVQRSISFNDTPLDIDSVSKTYFCLGETINMKLNIGNNDYESVLWDFGDGITYSSPAGATNNEKKTAQHTYTVPGWYDLLVTAKYVNACTGASYTEDLSLSFCVVRADTIWHVKDTCVAEDYQGEAKTFMDTVDYACDSVVVTQNFVHRVVPNRFDVTAFNDTTINGVYYDETPAEPITWTIEKGNYNQRCDSVFICNLTIKKCLNLEIANDSAAQFACYGPGGYDLPFSIHKDGDYGAVYFALEGQRAVALNPDAVQILEEKDGRKIGTITLPTENLQPGRYKATVEIEDNNCGGKLASPLLDLAVRYPEDVFNFKYNNVLAVYKPNHVGNEGWTFDAYQWYLNGDPIEGATESVYHTEAIFKSGDVYFVELTDTKGNTLPSCEFIVPDDLDNYEPQNNEPAAVKTFVGRSLYIRKGDVLYDMYGQRVK